VAPLLAVLLVFAAASAWAGETQSPPTDPPQARMNPPVGVTAQARMQPPVGAPAPLSRFDMLLLWLQLRISIPHG
jgi:hypothetical protein